MFVKLARYGFVEHPEWQLIEDSVPLGTVYEVVGFRDDGVMFNEELKLRKKCHVFLLRGNGDTGWLPSELFEEVE